MKKILLSEYNLANEFLVLDTLLSDPMTKQAQMGGVVSSIISVVKDFVNAHIDPNDKIGSITNMLAPGFIAMIFRSLGFKWTGTLIGILLNVLHVDVAGIVRSFLNSAKELIHSGTTITPGILDNISQNIIQQHNPGNVKAFTNKDLRILKLAIVNYNINKTALGLGSISGLLAVSSFTKLVKWIIQAILMAGGLMVAGQGINALVGRPSTFTNTWSKSQPVVTRHTSSQQVFKLNPSYQDTQHNTSEDDAWTIRANNSKSTIEDMLVNFAKSVYLGLDDKDSIIKSCSSFQSIVEDIVNWNRHSLGDNLIFIPSNFTSKKEIVDNFIDEVASKAK